MKLIEGLYWPDNDEECHSVILGQTKDIDVVLKYVDNFDVCVQAGGNVGLWPKILSKTFKQIYTFEPHPDNWACFKENVTEKNVKAYNAALGQSGWVSMVGEDKNCGAYQVEEGGDIPVFSVDSLQLDECDLIYLDIEGFELTALKGAVFTIAKFHPVIVVEDKHLSEKYGSEKGDIEEYLKAYGYEVAERVHRDVILVPNSR